MSQHDSVFSTNMMAPNETTQILLHRGQLSTGYVVAYSTAAAEMALNCSF